MYCKNCGAKIDDSARFCPKCGVNVENETRPVTAVNAEVISPKYRLVAALLCGFCGTLGVHRFYLGKIGTGIAMILTLGGLGFWVLIDIILILCGEFKDCDGLKVRRWLDNIPE